MHEDYEYVKSLEKEVDKLESEKANFSNMYDLLLEEYLSKDVTCSYLHSLYDLNAYAELQCMYLHKVKECECLAQKLSKQTESVNNEVHNKLLKKCEQYHEIQDLKAQMQDKNIAIKPDEGTDKPKVRTDKLEVSTTKPKEVEVSTNKLGEATAEPKDGTSDESTAPTTIFRDDETILVFDKPRATSTRSILTLKPLLKIDPQDKGKKVLEEEAESDAVDEAERKFDQLAKDEEIARKEVPCSTKSCCNQKQATNKLRNQMMTYLKHVGGKKHADLKNKNFEEIKVLYKEGTKKRKSGHVKMITRKRPRLQPEDDSDDEHVSSPDGIYLVVYRVNGPSGHLTILNRELAILEQTATGKGISNSLMAGSFPKTTKPT
ncbi:hypothetical protein Tco_1043442 [Tanacetum coccineum]|uniref:Uncharacterized protein n=1 Tax=Tanacetum coccineum TaxID=301880 RepID=A0ABQ5GP89_9ASTR